MTTTTESFRAAIEQLERHWVDHLRPRLDGLTDEEYLWEPVAGCWSVRRRGDERTAIAAGAGDTVCEFEMRTASPTPVTTIAWRMGHIAIGIFAMRAANHFGDPGTVAYETTDWPLTAAGGLDLLDRGYEAWMAGVTSLDSSGFDRPCGEAEGPYAERPFSDLVLHISREAIHHGAEIALLRDLYAHRATLHAG